VNVSFDIISNVVRRTAVQGFAGTVSTLMKHDASPGWHRINQCQCSRRGSAPTRREAPVCSTGTRR